MPDLAHCLSDKLARFAFGVIMPRKQAERKQQEDAHWYDDDELWLRLLRALDDSQAEHVARLFHRLAKELEQGADGAYRVRCCLENAQRLAFPYTRFAHECKTLFIDSLDAPESLTLAAIMERKRSR
jgi:hypothetical protein